MEMRLGLIVTLLAAFALAAPALARDGRRRRPKRKEPKVGQAAPDFELIKLPAAVAAGREVGRPTARGAEKGKEDDKVKLSEQWAKRPLVLVFSSYT